ncbi:DUF6371 domain-containing protein [Sabulilitoribacter arenilitoris]|uniref:DUF6371 domain-containing protein n=1 Tax=Wocania arenilitoris TaxID=2044858 RepID=A0AAE3ESE3_9FLAO|nr:DUF6371 domain-containing protein [Wocania arenilitoris]MCF7569479.1 DUF6371 domain-containing protein [Wocania arenilitoris]
METFKYSLDKSSKKYVCPNCNKKTFVFYFNTASGEYLPSQYGRCDREQNCSYHNAPPKGKKAYLIEFLLLKQISSKAVKLTDINGLISIIPTSQILEHNMNSCYITEWYLKTSIINYQCNEFKYFNSENDSIINEVKNIKPPDAIKPSYHKLELLDEMYNNNPIQDNLTEYLKTVFSKDEVNNGILNYYGTGTNHFWNNATVFWQIDHKENIRGAKIMLYDKHTGKRIKEPYNHINWLHKAIKQPDFNLNQCLFGLHLIYEDYIKDIAIVESEKTAIIMSLFLPDYIWLATGSKGNFKYKLLEPLKRRNCFAFPDKGEFINWNKTASELSKKGFNIAVSNILEQTDFNNGFDLADYYLIENTIVNNN